MYYKPKAGQTAIQRIAPVLSEATAEVLELRHTFCGCNTKICVRTDMLSAHLTLTKGATTELNDGTFMTVVHVSGKLLYQPVNACGSGYPHNNGCNPCNEPCPTEDVIFASFKVYSTVDDIEITSCAATATPITHSNCQDFTNQVLIVLPYNVDSPSRFGKRDRTPKAQ